VEFEELALRFFDRFGSEVDRQWVHLSPLPKPRREVIDHRPTGHMEPEHRDGDRHGDDQANAETGDREQFHEPKKQPVSIAEVATHQ
jgi:hypothetical protein